MGVKVATSVAYTNDINISRHQKHSRSHLKADKKTHLLGGTNLLESHSIGRRYSKMTVTRTTAPPPSISWKLSRAANYSSSRGRERQVHFWKPKPGSGDMEKPASCSFPRVGVISKTQEGLFWTFREAQGISEQAGHSASSYGVYGLFRAKEIEGGPVWILGSGLWGLFCKLGIKGSRRSRTRWRMY
jgi:hypothetical protein